MSFSCALTMPARLLEVIQSHRRDLTHPRGVLEPPLARCLLWLLDVQLVVDSVQVVIFVENTRQKVLPFRGRGSKEVARSLKQIGQWNASFAGTVGLTIAHGSIENGDHVLGS